MTSVSEGSSATLVIRRDLSLIPGCYTNSFEAATPGRIHEAPACPMDSYFAPWTVTIDPAIFNLKYWMVPPYRDDGNHRYEKTDTGSPV